jgi:hypothetical protein
VAHQCSELEPAAECAADLALISTAWDCLGLDQHVVGLWKRCCQQGLADHRRTNGLTTFFVLSSVSLP